METVIDNIDRAPKYIPIEDILELYDKPLKMTEVGRILGLSKQAISQRIQRARPKVDRLRRFKKHRGDVFAQKQVELLDALTLDDIKGMGGRDKVVSFGILYDKERLERGQSSVNLGVHTLVSQHEASLADLRARRAALETTTSRDKVATLDCEGVADGVNRKGKSTQPVVVEATEEGEEAIRFERVDPMDLVVPVGPPKRARGAASE